ncbi:MAG: universal stress protein [Acidimicrobiales bacterium]
MSTESQYMVVGIDGSPCSTKALQWAEANVDRFGLIQPVSALQTPWWAFSPTAFGATTPPSSMEFQAEAEKVARQALSQVDPTKLLEPLTVHGLTGPNLVTIGETASLIVVGTRGRGSLAAGVLGSVSLHCVNHAKVPVVVVPPDATVPSGFDRVVVGVDGSDSSIAALRWALRNTSSTSEIVAVYGWERDSSAVSDVASMAQDKLDELAQELIEDTVDRARRLEQSDRAVTLLPQCDDPRVVLREAAANADLLVVGARGRRGVAYLLLGSVASAVVNHPMVPTVVVR